MLLIIFVSTFVCITLGAMGVYWLLNRPQSAATQRLKRLDGKGGAAQASISVTIPDESPATELAERLASPINKMLPPSAIEAKKLQKQLMHAGFRSASAPIIYRAIQLISMGSFPLVVALICAILGRPITSALVWIILAFVVGFFLPRFAL